MKKANSGSMLFVWMLATIGHHIMKGTNKLPRDGFTPASLADGNNTKDAVEDFGHLEPS